MTIEILLTNTFGFGFFIETLVEKRAFSCNTFLQNTRGADYRSPATGVNVKTTSAATCAEMKAMPATWLRAWIDPRLESTCMHKKRPASE